jgi:hypothetical protein
VYDSRATTAAARPAGRPRPCATTAYNVPACPIRRLAAATATATGNSASINTPKATGTARPEASDAALTENMVGTPAISTVNGDDADTAMAHSPNPPNERVNPIRRFTPPPHPRTSTAARHRRRVGRTGTGRAYRCGDVPRSRGRRF